jgi:hypothetical protein
MEEKDNSNITNVPQQSSEAVQIGNDTLRFLLIGPRASREITVVEAAAANSSVYDLLQLVAPDLLYQHQRVQSVILATTNIDGACVG